jgi:hypothetical protein
MRYSLKAHSEVCDLSISIKMDVCVFVCPGITLERLERFQPNLVHILLYVVS